MSERITERLREQVEEIFDSATAGYIKFLRGTDYQATMIICDAIDARHAEAVALLRRLRKVGATCMVDAFTCDDIDDFLAEENANG